MNRKERVLKHTDVSGQGIEIAPYHNPILTKKQAPNLLILDVFDTETLREKANVDPLISASGGSQIEDVDLVGDACDIALLLEDSGLAGKIDFILSSHNFEHLPDPIRFFRGCSEALRPGGTLSMAIPDYRCCFDHFRFPTRLSDWLSAYHSSPKRPSPATIFDAHANQIRFLYGDQQDITTTLDRRNAPEAVLCFDVASEYERFQKELESPEPYTDAHCNILIPELFELYLRDLNYLGLVDFEVLEISRTHGIEFFAHLKKQEAREKPTAKEHQETRTRLLRAVSEQLGGAAFGRAATTSDGNSVDKARQVATAVVGTRAVDAVRSWNRQRRLNRNSRKG